MALELTYETEQGITLESAYVKIEDTNFSNTENDEGVEVRFYARIYANESAKEEDKPAISGYSFSMPLSISNAKTQYNLLKQGYLHLKTLDGFTDSIDS